MRHAIVLDIETTGLDPDTHEVIAVGWSDVDKYQPVVVVRRPSEPTDLFISRVVFKLQPLKTRTMIGYNIDAFDLPFLWKTSPFFSSWETIDLMPIVEGVFGRRYKLRDIVRMTHGFDDDDDDGEKIPELWEQGKIGEIHKHQEADVKRTWLLANFLRPWWDEWRWDDV